MKHLGEEVGEEGGGGGKRGRETKTNTNNLAEKFESNVKHKKILPCKADKHDWLHRFKSSQYWSKLIVQTNSIHLDQTGIKSASAWFNVGMCVSVNWS